MDHAPREPASPEYESDLVDLHDLTLREVLALDDSVLGHALRRLWQEADHPEEPVAGWNAGI